MVIPDDAIAILFSGPMTLAVHERRKTETRRPLKAQPEPGRKVQRVNPNVVAFVPHDWTLDHALLPEWSVASPWPKGSILWCREALESVGGVAHYRADLAPVVLDDGSDLAWRWKRDTLPAIHMPKDACRMSVRVLGTTAAKLSTMTERDALAEGFDTLADFRALWNKLHAKRPALLVERDPWAWRIRFAVHEAVSDD
jgi:hypothetical protein